jgi:hypothetical protein
MLDEPLIPVDVETVLRTILRQGEFRFSLHAVKEMAKDDLSTVDCVNVLRAGVAGPGERECGSWRYPVRTSRITVVVAFRSENSFVVVTAWRHQRRLGSGQ